jgi:hypothetical protein
MYKVNKLKDKTNHNIAYKEARIKKPVIKDHYKRILSLFL